jgi:hypothetical protein
MTNAERIELNALARKAQDELGRLHGPEVTLETLDGLTPFRAGDRVIIRETIRDAGLHNGSVATVQRVQGSVLFVERRDGQTVPIDTRQFPGVQHGYAHTEYREQTRYAELHLVDQHVNQRSLIVGMTRHTHRYGMHYSAEAVGSFENLVQFGERSRDKISLDDFAVRDLVAEQRGHRRRRSSARRSSASAKRRPNGKPSAKETSPWHSLSSASCAIGACATSRTTTSLNSCPRSAWRLQKYTTVRKPRSWRTLCKKSSRRNSRVGCGVSRIRP